MFIKTKTNIFKVIEDGENSYIVKTKHKDKLYVVSKKRTPIIAFGQLHDLIDITILKGIGQIILNDNNEYSFEGRVWYPITEKELKTGIYGGIWKEDGIKFVAKFTNRWNLC